MRWLLLLGLGCGLAPPLRADEPRAPEKGTKYEIPYRLTDTKHVLVRAKINGKGPFNLILDTGAPAVFITKAVAKKAGVEVDAKDFGTFGAFELEGGVKLDKVRARVEDLVQLDGMNGLGLAGVELHGVVGYNVLAKFRIEYDFTADKLTFVSLPGFEPPAPEKIDAKGGTDIQTLGPMVKMLAAMMGIEPNFQVLPRGFVGIEFDDANGAVVVKKVITSSAAEKAGIKSGDTIQAIKPMAADGGKEVAVESGKDMARALARGGVGTKFRFTVKRGSKVEELTVELGKGL